MRRILRARLLVSAVVFCIVPFATAAIPAQAQARSDISFDSFHDQLARYGDWVYSDRWGMVWQPANVPDDFRPYYSGGRWAYTRAYGWTWASDYDWGDIAFHYGRWVDDPYDGWMWLPGYAWSPGWVIWRSNTRSVGWMAMPPDNQFLSSRNDNYFAMSFGGISINWNDTSGNYGYSRWYGRDYDQRRFAANWTFVDTGRMADRDYRGAAYAPDRALTSIRQTTNITNYKVVNNYMVNSSIDARTVERASGHPIAVTPPAAVLKHPNLVITIDAGQKARAREFDRVPHGTGLANSAPQPPPAVINKLSDHITAPHAGAMAGNAGARGAGGPSHLFTKTTIAAPAAASQFHGTLRAGSMSAPPVSAPTPPAGTPALHSVPAPAIAKPAAGTMMGPSGGGTTPMPGGKMRGQHMGGPGAATVPTGAPVAQEAKPFEHKPPPAMTGPAAAKPMEHKMMLPATEPVVKPVTAPVAKPVEHKVMPTPSAQTPPPAVHKPPPAVHVPPPAVVKPKPSAKPQDVPEKDEHKDKTEQDKPN